MSQSIRTHSVTRRNFAFGAAVAATAVLLPATEIHGQDSAGPSAAGAMAKLSPAARAEVEMKVSEIFRKYGTRLSEEQKADIRKVMAETQDGLEKMRAFALTNADQPASVFKFLDGVRTQAHAE